MTRSRSLIILLIALVFALPASAQEPLLADDINPQWSPDGTRIAFLSWREGERGLYVMDADGANVRRLGIRGNSPPVRASQNFYWSPDGAQIAFDADLAGNSVTFIAEVESGRALPLFRSFTPSFVYGWSPDGARVVYAESISDGLYRLKWRTPDARTEQIISLFSAVAYYVQPSPDGSRIAYTAITSDLVTDRQTVYVVEPDGAIRDVLDGWQPGTEEGIVNWVWTPDGSAIVIRFGLDDRLVVASASAGEATLLQSEIEPSEALALTPSPSPEGEGSATAEALVAATDEAVTAPTAEAIAQAAADLRLYEDIAGNLTRMTWLADGRLLIQRGRDYSQDAEDPTLLGAYTLDMATGALEQASMMSEFNAYPLPNDERIVLDGGYFAGSLNVAFLDGTIDYELISGYSNQFGLSLSPGGDRFLASLCVLDNADVYVFDLATGAASNLTAEAAVPAGASVPRECGSAG